MKRILYILFASFLIFSCSRDSEESLKNLEREISEVRESNNRLQERLDSIDTHFLRPFNLYQQTLIIETDISPDSIIQRYNNIIEEFPDTFWSHEAKKRKNNVDERRDYWKNGEWNLPSNNRKITLPAPGVISCPGC